MGEGASVTGRTGSTVSFSYHKGPNVLIFLLLLVLFVVPAIIYGIVESREVRFTLTATPAEGGCRLLFGGEYGAGYGEFSRWHRRAPGPNPELFAVTAEDASPYLDETSAGTASDIPSQIRQLAGLKDAGVITPEEFEAKKAELLDRL